MAFDIDAIRPGDVLLFHGRGFVSWAIRAFDGTEVNHAAIAIDEDRLAEAVASGLESRPIVDALGSNDFMIVRRLEGPDLKPVVFKADEYLDRELPYAFQQIVLLAVLALTRRLPAPRLVRRILRSALDHAAAALNAFIDEGRQFMICSEYVFRAFDEASSDVPDPFELAIPGVTFAARAEQPWIDWALAQSDDDLAVPVSPTFARRTPATPDLIEDELAPLIAQWADETGLADTLPERLPTTFAAPPAEPTDEELVASMVGFSDALAAARGGTPVTFGLGTAIGGTAARGALRGLKDIAVEPNFVTPGDLLKTPSLITLGRSS